MNQRTYGLAVIGAGRIFAKHARAAEMLGRRVRLVGVADTDAIKLSHASDQFSVPIATRDYRDLLEREDVDIVAVCTPPSTHEQMVIAALEAGKYVICEKPLAHTVEAADRIAQAAEAYPGRLSVVHQMRFLPDVRKIIWLRDNGRLGRLACGEFLRFDRMDPRAVKWWGRWQTAGGGVVMTQFIHELDLACHVFGEPIEVHAYADTFSADIESEDTFTATIRFRSGAMASCCATLCAHTPHQRWHIFGTRGMIENPFAAHTNDPAQLERDLQQLKQLYPPLSNRGKKPSMHILARIFRKGLRTLRLGGNATPPPPTPQHLPYYRAVLDAMDAGEPLPVDAASALASLELCTAIYISAMTDETVPLPLDRTHPYCRGITRDDYQAHRYAGAGDAGEGEGVAAHASS